MNHNNKTQWGKMYLAATTTTAVILGLSLAASSLAAPPHTVTYGGKSITTGVPGKPFTVKFHVKNTQSSAFPGVRIVFHLPDGLKHSKVTPANADVQEETVTWENLYMESGQSFYPTFTFTIDANTPIKTKKSMWVEVTAPDMEATSTNFSFTAVKTVSTTTSVLSSADIKTMFQSVHGRTPTTSELNYWLGRRADKPGRTALQGAMGYHKIMKITH